MTMKKSRLLLLISLFLFFPVNLYAQGELDSFYRPYSKNELDYRLRPYLPDASEREDYLDSLRRQHCPDEINIGNISEDSRIFGNVDIEIIIDEDFYIDCSQF